MTLGKSAAKIFKDARHNKGLTQVEVAQKAGLHPNTYAKIERGVAKPAPSSIKKLARALDIDSSKIFDLLD